MATFCTAVWLTFTLPLTPGKGDLASEKKKLERQADAADLSVAGENLLAPNKPNGAA